MKAIGLPAMALIPLLSGLAGLVGKAAAFAPKAPSSDSASLEFEPYPLFGGSRFQGPAVAEASADRAWRLAGQMAFPAGKVGETQFFGQFKSTFMDRENRFRDETLNDGVLKRFWLSGGATWPGPDGQSNLALGAAGINSDFADIGPMDFNTEWIYAHFWTVSPSFNWGIGLDVQQYFRKAQPYPLVFIEWKAGERTKLKWDADYIELRRFLSPGLCFTAGVRFNLEFFALEDDATYEYNSMGLEGGLQYAVARNTYLRLKYKELVWGKEEVGLPDRSTHAGSLNAGRSLRFNIAYGM